MNLYELLSIFPFGEDTHIILRDRKHKAIREAMIHRSVYWKEDDVQIPEDIIPYCECPVLEFYPDEGKINIQIDLDLQPHIDYVYAISLTIK